MKIHSIFRIVKRGALILWCGNCVQIEFDNA